MAMESGDDTWMQQEETRGYEDASWHLIMEAGEAAERSELLLRENERLLAQQKKQSDEIKQLQLLIGKASCSTPVQRVTPAGYKRGTASDPDVFIMRRSR